MSQDIKNGNGNIQIIGDSNRVIQADESPAPGNPNLIACPACEKYGIYRLADKCPRCHYSFEIERLRFQQEERHKREQGAQVLAVMAVGIISAAIFGADKFHLDWKQSFGFGVVVVLSAYTTILFVRVGVSTAIKRWQRKI